MNRETGTEDEENEKRWKVATARAGQTPLKSFHVITSQKGDGVKPKGAIQVIQKAYNIKCTIRTNPSLPEDVVCWGLSAVKHDVNQFPAFVHRAARAFFALAAKRSTTPHKTCGKSVWLVACGCKAWIICKQA